MFRAHLKWLMLYAAIHPTGVGAWTSINAPGDCSFGQMFDGPGSTKVLVVQTKDQFDDDTVIIAFSNDNWSLSQGDEIKDPIIVDVDGTPYKGAATAVDGEFMFRMNSKVFDELSESSPISVKITMGDKVVDRLGFSGFYGAYLGFRSCQREWREARDDRKRLEAIDREVARDPFAK